MIEIMNWATLLAYFAVFLMGLVTCFKEAKLAWLTRNTDGLTIFDRRNYVLKASCSLVLALLAIGGLLQAIAGA